MPAEKLKETLILGEAKRTLSPPQKHPQCETCRETYVNPDCFACREPKCGDCSFNGEGGFMTGCKLKSKDCKGPWKPDVRRSVLKKRKEKANTSAMAQQERQPIQ